MKKKAQVVATPQSYISLLIFVIGLALILYIMMLPPADRAELLEQNRTNPNDDKSTVTIIMNREPGTLSNIADDEIIHDLPSFELFSKTEPSVISSFDSIYVKKSLFEEQERNISFSIGDFENTANFVLSFTVPKMKGILTIYLNGKILTSDSYTTASPAPIKLPKDWLQKDNTIIFRVSGPGAEFWASNEYLIQNMKITADVTDNSGIENKQLFVVTEEEKANLESFTLSFVTDCKTSDVSPLQIYLNKRLIYSSIPDCGTPISVPSQDSTRIKEGENDLLFRAEKGFYEVYSIEGKLKLKKPLFPTYYFSIDKDRYAKLNDGQANLNITMLFTNDEDKKEGVVLINGIKRDIDEYDRDFNWKVNEYAREGNNAVEIIPKSDKLEILELKVLYAE